MIIALFITTSVIPLYTRQAQTSVLSMGWHFLENFFFFQGCNPR